jgi:hypothetical protein
MSQLEWQTTHTNKSRNTWRYTDDTMKVVEIRLNVNCSTFIDADQKEKVLQRKWRIKRDPRCDGRTNSQYVVTSSLKSDGGSKAHTIKLHQFLMGSSTEGVDHINRESLDNRMSNLRVAHDNAFAAMNSNNRKLYCTNKTGVSGVRHAERKKSYIAKWCINRKERTRTFGYGIKCLLTQEEAKEQAFAFRKLKDTETGCTNGHTIATALLL